LEKFKVFPSERSVLKKIFTGKSGLHCQKECLNKFQFAQVEGAVAPASSISYSYACLLLRRFGGRVVWKYVTNETI